MMIFLKPSTVDANIMNNPMNMQPWEIKKQKNYQQIFIFMLVACLKLGLYWYIYIIYIDCLIDESLQKKTVDENQGNYFFDGNN